MAFPDNPGAKVFAQGGAARADYEPRPLYDAAGKLLLLDAFAAIDTRSGSVGAYLEKDVGVTAADLAAPRANYLA